MDCVLHSLRKWVFLRRGTRVCCWDHTSELRPYSLRPCRLLLEAYHVTTPKCTDFVFRKRISQRRCCCHERLHFYIKRSYSPLRTCRMRNLRRRRRNYRNVLISVTYFWISGNLSNKMLSHDYVVLCLNEETPSTDDNSIEFIVKCEV